MWHVKPRCVYELERAAKVVCFTWPYTMNIKAHMHGECPTAKVLTIIVSDSADKYRIGEPHIMMLCSAMTP